ncbi:MAG: hypothetical protein FWD53_00845 [Phycisphaerales bacterium]|nr:hypothetical protein [Phycisphaerales bacterium]
MTTMSIEIDEATAEAVRQTAQQTGKTPEKWSARWWSNSSASHPPVQTNGPKIFSSPLGIRPPIPVAGSGTVKSFTTDEPHFSGYQPKN